MNPEILRHPRLWLGGFILWAAALFALSSFSAPVPPGGPEIPHLDKVMHFVYFMGGAFCFATFLLSKYGPNASVLIRVAAPIAVFASIGALDEWHQTFTPGRSGNDPYDWLADVLGSLTGILIANGIHPLLVKLTSRASRKIT